LQPQNSLHYAHFFTVCIGKIANTLSARQFCNIGHIKHVRLVYCVCDINRQLQLGANLADTSEFAQS